jgi:prevent-host-death family protein
MQAWPMTQAATGLSEIVTAAASGGPQEITVQGRPVAVVLSPADYGRLAGAGESLVTFMRRSPLAGDEDLDFVRDPSPS